MTRASKPRAAFGLSERIDRARRFFEHGLWDADRRGASALGSAGLTVTRVLSLAWRGMVQNNCLERASGLTYITVLSLVPLLAFAFSMAKGFGAYDRLVETTITPFLNQMAPPPDAAAGGGAQEIRDAAENILGFVGNTSFANLGLIGLTFLIVTALRLMTTIEGVFNAMWGVRRARPLIRKVTDFVALLAITPILLLIATTVTVSLQSNAVTEFMTTSLGLGVVVQVLSRLIPLVMVWLGFAVLYIIMPNTKVLVGPALVGGIVGGTIWQAVQVLHIQFQVGVANYNAIYAGFAALPLFLVWIYMNWVAVLIGGLVVWASQTLPSYHDIRRVSVTSFADREALALRLSIAVATAFADGRGATPLSALVARCGAAPAVVQDVAETLIEAGLLARTGDGSTQALLPARPLSRITAERILQALRGEYHDDARQDDVAVTVIGRLHDAMRSAPDNRPLANLIERTAPGAASEPPDEPATGTPGAAAPSPPAPDELARSG